MQWRPVASRVGQAALDVGFWKPDEPDCFMPKEGIDNLLTLAPSSPYPVSWVINKSDLGEIDVEFAILSNYTDYIINLATGHLIFQYVYTGCYRIEIESSSPNRFEGSYKSFTRFIKTDYVKIGLTKSPIFNHNFYNSMMLRLIFSFDHDAGGHQLSIKLSDEINFDLKDVCQDSGSEVMCCSYMVDVEDDRCDVNSVWITPPNYCRRTLVLNLNETLPSYDLTELFSGDSYNIILSVMLSILVLALVLVALCYFKTMMYSHQDSRHRRDDSLRKPSFIPLVGGGKDNPVVVHCRSYCNACEIQTND
uniref:Uncharacterized protein n=1 Tax=Timema poppense TaxID=170557 RepID=A0A7R9DEY3_TIMPO|nr:unnamed protein product [Timema poppensis]